MVACGELRLNRIALERCLQALPNIPPPTQACARPCSSDKGRKDNNKEKTDFRHRSASTASPSPATRICETASVENHPYLVNTFRRMRPDAESMSQVQHSHVAQRSTPLPSHPALTYASDAEGRSARQTSLSCESR